MQLCPDVLGKTQLVIPILEFRRVHVSIYIYLTDPPPPKPPRTRFPSIHVSKQELLSSPSPHSIFICPGKSKCSYTPALPSFLCSFPPSLSHYPHCAGPLALTNTHKTARNRLTPSISPQSSSTGIHPPGLKPKYQPNNPNLPVRKGDSPGNKTERSRISNCHTLQIPQL